MKKKFLLIIFAIVIMASTLTAHADSYISTSRKVKSSASAELAGNNAAAGSIYNELGKELQEDNITAIYDSVPVIMYHLISDDPQNWSEYCISSWTLEEDFKYIKTMNYTPIFASEYKLIKEGNLRVKNPIIITFDDGYTSDLNIVMPILEKYEIKANFFIIGTMVKDNSYAPNGHMTQIELKKLSESEYVEIGSHSYELHLKSPKELEMLCNSRGKINTVIADFKANEEFIEEIIGKKIHSVSFPYGIVPLDLDSFMASLPYDAVFSSNLMINSIYSNEHALGRFNRPNGISTKEFYDTLPKRAQTGKVRVVQGKQSAIGGYK